MGRHDGTNVLLSPSRPQPTESCHGVMNYKRHNQGLRAHIRRKYLGGYWLPKWAREKRDVSRKRKNMGDNTQCNKQIC